jgi:hypothetical protein
MLFGRRVLVARHRVRQAFERVIYVEVSVDDVTDQGEVGCRTTAITAALDHVAFETRRQLEQFDGHCEMRPV